MLPTLVVLGTIILFILALVAVIMFRRRRTSQLHPAESICLTDIPVTVADEEEPEVAVPAAAPVVVLDGRTVRFAAAQNIEEE